MTDKRTLLYEGKAKNLYQTDDTAVVLAAYKDQATALNGKKKDQIVGKGELNNQITSLIFRELNRRGVHTHFIEQVSPTEQLNTKVAIIPLEVVVRNYTAGSFSKRFGIEEGIKIPTPIVEFYYKNDDLDDPFINDAHVKFLDIATDDEIATEANVKDLLRLYPNAPTKFVEINPQQHGYKYIGHMLMFKKSHQKLWPLIESELKL